MILDVRGMNMVKISVRAILAEQRRFIYLPT